MTPDELKRANIDRFRRLIAETVDEPDRRACLERLLVEELNKPSSAYPHSG